jgi:hypothetical protein
MTMPDERISPKVIFCGRSLFDRLLARSIGSDAAADRADNPVIQKRTEDPEHDSAILLAKN